MRLDERQALISLVRCILFWLFEFQFNDQGIALCLAHRERKHSNPENATLVSPIEKEPVGRNRSNKIISVFTQSAFQDFFQGGTDGISGTVEYNWPIRG